MSATGDPSAKLRARVVALARAQDPFAHIFEGKAFRRDYVAARAAACHQIAVRKRSV